MNKKWIGSASMLLAATTMASPVQINVDCKSPTVSLSPHLYGLFFEDINYGADGGIYAELVQNRSFEYFAVNGNDPLGKAMHPLYAWEAIEGARGTCNLSVENTNPLNEKNINYLKMEITGAAGVRNNGFDGIPVDKGAKYDLSFYARNENWKGDAQVTVSLVLDDGTVCGSAVFKPVGEKWNKFEGVIIATETTDNASLVISAKAEGKGTLYLDMVSLFPQDTYGGRKNGMRKDLVQALVDLNPKFLRFPGGCIAHGDCLENVYRWKDTVGDVAERKPNWNLWGYHQTYGLGYYEYFLLCEDIGATPLPVVPVGVSCGFRGPQQCVAMDELTPWIDDALDLIEFANGDVTTEWGALRAKMGHPEPFNLEFLCLGNEPHDNALFRDRFPHFVKAVREQHPEIKIIGTSGLTEHIPIYDLMNEQKVYSSDEHYYLSPQWYFANTHRFDNFDRSKPKIFIGEYASLDRKLYNALSEAAYLTGIERNADIVDMTCYAPLFGSRNHSQWNPDMIYFDHRNVVKTPSYYVQQLFACNKGDVYLKSSMTESNDDAEMPTLAGRIGIGTWHTTIEVEDVRVNGKAIDTSNWESSVGDFNIHEDSIVQRDVNAEAAMALSPVEYKGKIVTYSLKARRTSGREGFLVQFGTKDGQSDFWWNIAGWSNSRHALQMGIGRDRSEVTPSALGHIETGKWYDLKVVMAPGNIKCYIDDQLIHDYTIEKPSISMASTYDQAAGEVILKLVNPREEATEVTINLNEAGTIEPTGTLMLVAGAKNAENTFENPELVKTEVSSIPVGKSFDYTLPPCSVQFIRIKAK